MSYKLYKSFIGKSCFTIRESGNNPNLICDRARNKANYLIKLLQVALINSKILHESNLLFTQAGGVAIKLLSDQSTVKHNWRRSFSPIRRGIDDLLEKRILEFFDKIHLVVDNVQLNPRFRKSFIHALTWIGRAIEEEDIDIRIIYLSTAIESILTVESDERKGETIAYRMMLLNSYIEKSFSDPSKILDIYNIRSKVIHGSELTIATIGDYYSFRIVSIETLENALLIIERNDIDNKRELIKILEAQEELVKEVLKWLDSRGDKNSPIIAGQMRKNIFQKDESSV